MWLFLEVHSFHMPLKMALVNESLRTAILASGKRFFLIVHMSDVHVQSCFQTKLGSTVRLIADKGLLKHVHSIIMVLKLALVPF